MEQELVTASKSSNDLAADDRLEEALEALTRPLTEEEEDVEVIEEVADQRSSVALASSVTSESRTISARDAIASLGESDEDDMDDDDDDSEEDGDDDHST
jgi:hypothetical protein